MKITIQDLPEKWRVEAKRLRHHRDLKPRELTIAESAALTEHAQTLELCARELETAITQESEI